VSYKPNVGVVSVTLEADDTTLAPPPAANALPVAHAARRFAAFSHLFNYVLLALGLENLTSGDRKTILKLDLIGSTSASVQQGIAAPGDAPPGRTDMLVRAMGITCVQDLSDRDHTVWEVKEPTTQTVNMVVRAEELPNPPAL